MCTACEPWCTAHVKKISAVAVASLFVPSCCVARRPEKMIQEMQKYAIAIAMFAEVMICQSMAVALGTRVFPSLVGLSPAGLESLDRNHPVRTVHPSERRKSARDKPGARR